MPSASQRWASKASSFLTPALAVAVRSRHALSSASNTVASWRSNSATIPLPRSSTMLLATTVRFLRMRPSSSRSPLVILPIVVLFLVGPRDVVPPQPVERLEEGEERARRPAAAVATLELGPGGHADGGRLGSLLLGEQVAFPEGGKRARHLVILTSRTGRINHFSDPHGSASSAAAAASLITARCPRAGHRERPRRRPPEPVRRR